jgi:FPC/CPF motif-containing protein YcgG
LIPSQLLSKLDFSKDKICSMVVAPKQYWQYLNSLRNEDNTNKNMDIPTNFDELVNHFQSQGEPESFNLDIKKECNRSVDTYTEI